jgi:hypothetical protein
MDVFFRFISESLLFLWRLLCIGLGLLLVLSAVVSVSESSFNDALIAFLIGMVSFTLGMPQMMGKFLSNVGAYIGAILIIISVPVGILYLLNVSLGIEPQTIAFSFFGGVATVSIALASASN